MTYVDDVTEAFLLRGGDGGVPRQRSINIGGRAAGLSCMEIAGAAAVRLAGPAAQLMRRGSSRPSARAIDIGSYHADDRRVSRRDRVGGGRCRWRTASGDRWNGSGPGSPTICRPLPGLPATHVACRWRAENTA